jgi:SAM-dependent methyltransferase
MTDEGKVMSELLITPCYFCSNNLERPSKNRRRINFGLIRSFYYCGYCKGYSLYPKLKATDFDTLYDDTYMEDVSCDSSSRNQLSRFDLVKSILSSEAENKFLKFLDYGCSAEAPLLVFGKGLGIECMGVEVSLSTRIAANKASGCEILSPFDFSNSKLLFDFIFLGDVLEHVNNPQELLRELGLHLEPYGLMIAQGPLDGSKSISNILVEIKSRILGGRETIFPPYHVSLASKKSMVNLFSNSKMEIITLNTKETWWPISVSKLLKPIKYPGNLLLALAKVLDFVFWKFRLSSGSRYFIVASRSLIKQD